MMHESAHRAGPSATAGARSSSPFHLFSEFLFCNNHTVHAMRVERILKASLFRSLQSTDGSKSDVKMFSIHAAVMGFFNGAA